MGRLELDVHCAVGAARGTIMKRNELYVQRSDGSFDSLASRFGVLEPFARGRSGTFVDADGLGGPDPFVANFPDRADGLPSPNHLFINEGGSTPARPRAATRWPPTSTSTAGTTSSWTLPTG
jgi:hypothetical protein